MRINSNSGVEGYAKGKNIAVFADNHEGLTIASYFVLNEATITILSAEITNISEKCKEADIVIIDINTKPKMINGTCITCVTITKK